MSEAMKAGLAAAKERRKQAAAAAGEALALDEVMPKPRTRKPRKTKTPRKAGPSRRSGPSDRGRGRGQAACRLAPTSYRSSRARARWTCSATLGAAGASGVSTYSTSRVKHQERPIFLAPLSLPAFAHPRIVYAARSNFAARSATFRGWVLMRAASTGDMGTWADVTHHTRSPAGAIGALDLQQWALIRLAVHDRPPARLFH